ncbi:septal ring lytic transglycosylase RlpA family protein [Gallaecimonas sp. GXIMD4217]|uniref:septal ring lytic transglycosylase RlpA family protein n=1 Tax=Gallaecimonas sp. GXIMD4217 TaxID=3131927 RepID=UPI00311B2748
MRKALPPLLLILAGCQSAPPSQDIAKPVPTEDDPNAGRYSQAVDAYPDSPPELGEVQDVPIRAEPYSAQGNRDYQLRGKHYRVLKQAEGFVEQGHASWYGTKFHGHTTSNGETYDMYAMSGAHKTLPLPSYVKVTNLNNQKTVVVRVNDRGPFHPGRIIDLSYAAAYKLDMLKAGTAPVRIEVVMPDTQASVLTPLKGEQKQIFVQVAATGDQDRANAMARRLAGLLGTGYQIAMTPGLYKVRLGPARDELHAEALIERLKDLDVPQPFKVYRAPKE